MDWAKEGKIPRGRKLAILGYILLYVVAVGFPVWYYTTKIERVKLPTQKIKNINSFNTQPQRFISIIDEQKQIQVQDLEKCAIQNQTQIMYFNQLKNITENLQGNYVIYIKTSATEEMQLNINNKREFHFNFPENWNKNKRISTLCQFIKQIFSDFQYIQSMFNQQLLFSKNSFIMQFSLCVADPEDEHWQWNFENFKNNLENRFLNFLRNFVDIQIEHQIIYYVKARVKGRWNQNQQQYQLNQKQLSYFVDSEWPLDSGIISNYEQQYNSHILHFIIYVPERVQLPLIIQNKNKNNLNSFIIPGWGGVFIFNPKNNNQSDFQKIIQSHQQFQIVENVIFQLRKLFNFDSIQNLFQKLLNDDDKSKLNFDGFDEVGVNFLEEDIFLINGLLNNIQDAIRILNSLTKLISDLPNLAIPEQIKQHVEKCVFSIEQAQHLCQVQGGLFEAYNYSKLAKFEAEAAFGHPAILSQLNVSFRHKAAIYVPFFMPVSVPIIIKFLKEVVRYVKRRQAARKYRQEVQIRKRE
eukprot:TRINITY_DN1953_c0_g1_i4.p1 TRINITY_DN1953_c0_g1~~TRINITY_DN1953_c0_g1_i4.p1  ORF type:complete len:550 (-),score=38.05 TRINITY_DN1953_c0_g1_i4:203-1774(-)